MIKENCAPPRRGRPRAFDRDAALDCALRLFWRRGYENTSIGDLTGALGIHPPSLYAAFGDKERLFLAALDRYAEGPGAVPARLLAEAPSAREGVRRVLAFGAASFCDPDAPGCLVAGTEICDPRLAAALAERRRAARDLLRARLERAASEGELPSGTDVAVLADYVDAVFVGMAKRAREGATAAELEGVAVVAMRAWPEA